MWSSDPGTSRAILCQHAQVWLHTGLLAAARDLLCPSPHVCACVCLHVSIHNTAARSGGGGAKKTSLQEATQDLCWATGEGGQGPAGTRGAAVPCRAGSGYEF